MTNDEESIENKEELSKQLSPSSPQPPKRKRLIAIVASVFLIGLIIGLSVGLTNRFKKERENESSASKSALVNNVNKTNAPTPSEKAKVPTPTSAGKPTRSSSTAKPSAGETDSQTKAPINAPTASVPVATPTSSPVAASESPVRNMSKVKVGEIIEGVAANVAYFHCFGNTTGQRKDLLLLHGASFTKEIWKDKGLMDMFCAKDDISVTALDLSIYAKHDELQEVMDALVSDGIIGSLPIDGIVTPSASGATLVDWIFNGDVSTLKDEILVWIPVAPPSVESYTQDQFTDKIGDWKVLAIYGDRDKMGKKVSEILGNATSDSKVVELSGGHPVYLWSQDEFVKTVVDYVS